MSGSGEGGAGRWGPAHRLPGSAHSSTPPFARSSVSREQERAPRVRERRFAAVLRLAASTTGFLIDTNPRGTGCVLEPADARPATEATYDSMIAWCWPGSGSPHEAVGVHTTHKGAGADSVRGTGIGHAQQQGGGGRWGGWV
jgi:hypothetical protein